MSNPFTANAAPAANEAPAASTPPAPAANEAPAMTTPSAATGAAPTGNLSDMFATGSKAGDGARLKDDLGHAVVIRPTEFIADLATSNGPSDCVRADWVILEGPNQGVVRTDSLIFNAVVRNTLKGLIGTATPFCVGVVAEGTAKPGKSAPLVLADPAPEHLELAKQAVTAHGWFNAN